MAQGVIGLRILMEGGMFLNLMVSEFEAKQLISSFVNNTLKPVVGNPEGPFGTLWSVRTESIRAMHTFNPAELQAASQQGQAPQYAAVPGRLGTPFGGTSGL